MSSHVRHASHGRVRRTLRLGAGAAALASSLLLAPGGALAKDRCSGLAGAGCTLTAPVLAPATPAAAEPLPQDLTLRVSPVQAAVVAPRSGGIMVASAGSAALAPVKAANVIDPTVAAVPGWPDSDVVVDEGTVVKTGDNTPGIGTVTNGTTTIKAGSISTDGSVSAGVHAEGSGQITIDVGTVETVGWRSDGIFATTNVGGSTGGIAITAGSVNTTGDLSNGITATAYRGDVTIDVGQVKTTGYGAGGIYANGGQGNTTVKAGTVETSGESARGIVAYSNGATKVVVDSVSTVGGGAFQDANAGAIIAMGTSVEVQAGSVSTQGDYSDGIYATSNFAYDNGQASHDISVTAGSVSTAGNHAAGVVAINVYGDNHIDVGTVKTTGDFAPGIYAVSVYGGSTNIKAGEVSTAGYASHGVYGKAIFGGDVSIDVGKVTTAGDFSPAVYGLAYYGDITIKAGEVSTSGMQSGGIIGNAAFGGHVGIQAGQVTTTGDYSAGVQAISGQYPAPSAGRGIDIDIQDGVTTSGRGSHGIVAYSYHGDINIASKGDVVASGFGAMGINAISYMGDIAINAGKVETAGTLGIGIAVLAIGGDVSIHADKIVTSGDYATGVSIFAPRSDATVTVGDISTDGLQSFGVSMGGENASLHAANILTGGDDSIGANVQAYLGDGSLTVDGSVVTKGTGSTALNIRAAYDATVSAGSIHTYGDKSRGIVATSVYGDVIVNVGDITTQGALASGIVATTLGETGGVTINGTGTIHVSGYAANGIDVISDAGPIKINNPGTIQVDGDYGAGIYARVLNGGGAIDIDAGDLVLNGYRSSGVVALGLGDVNVDVGNISGKGGAVLGLVAISNGGGAVNVKAGDINIVGTAIQVGTDGNVTIDVGDIENSSGSSRSIRVESKGDVVIDAGSVTSRGTFDAKAIDVMTEGAVVVRAENVLTSGYNANAIDVRGATADIHVTGDVVTGLDQSLGIHVRSNSGQANVKVDGTIFTNGIGSKGLYAVGSENVFLSVNEVITKRDGSYGVVGVSTGGDVEIVSNTVATDGANSVGLYGAVHDAYGTGFTGDVTIEAGNIATRGANSVGAAGINTTVGGNVTITVKDVTTRRENAFGVLAYSAYGSGTVVAGNISTRGPAAKGIMVDVNQKADVTANSVSTLGDVSTGITAWSFMGSKVSVAKVETSGPGSHGVDGLAGFQQDLVALRGDVDLTVGEAITHGDLSIGILAKSAYGDVNVAAGSITTSGDDSIGLFVQSFGNIKARDKVISELNVDSVSTKGKFSDAVYFGGELSELNLVAGDLSTKGDNASGVRTFTTATNQDIVVDNVTTDGVLSRGIFAHSVAGDINVKVNGTITTSGQDAVGIRTNSSVSHVTIEAGHIVTTGDKAQGIYSFLVGIGSARVADIKVETITTAGAASHGIYVYNLNGGVIAYSQEAAMADAGTSVSQVRHLDGHDTPTIGKSTIPTRTVKAGSFVPGRSLPDMFDVAATDGAGLNDITIEAGKIEVGGKGANGIFVRGSGRVTTKIGSVKAADAEAIKISALAENTLAIAGSVTSGNNDAVFLSGSDVSITMAGGSKVGGQNGIVALANGPQPDGEIGIPVEPGIGLPEEPGIGIPGGPEEPGIGIGIGGVPSRGAVAPLDGPAGGTVRIENAGTISGVMKAIDIGAGTAIINNRGVIDGAVVTGGGDDSFVNSGTWMFAASGSYANDFGAGNDTLVNSGIVRLATPTGGKAGKGWIYGLDRFENSGTLSLQNGVAGDILTLDGNYVASGKARLGIDIGGNGKVADTLVVEGAATGSTSISLTSTDGYGATLLNGPLKIVTVGAGSSANAFTLESTDIGFVRYGLTYDAASRSYSVLSTAGAPVYRFARLNEGAQSIWLKSAEAFTTHMRTSRDLGDPGKRIWGQMSGGVSNRDETRAVAGGNGFAAASYDLDYRQDFYGGELGFDAVQGEGVTAGIMGGYTSSTQRFKANGDKGRTDALNVGVYGGVTKGVVFANLLVKYDHFSTHVSSQEMDWNDKIGGHSIGVQGEVGARLGSAKFFVEPAASLAWQSTSLGDIEALDQKIAFDKADGLRGRIGARLGGVTKLGGTELTFYGAGDFVHEFKGKDGATLLSGGQSVWVPGARMDDYGQATLGLDIKGSGPVSGFIQGSGTFGSSYSGVDGRAGIRFAF